MAKTIVLRYNDRNYWPPEWEAWKESQVIAHSESVEKLREEVKKRNPTAEITVVDLGS